MSGDAQFCVISVIVFFEKTSDKFEKKSKKVCTKPKKYDIILYNRDNYARFYVIRYGMYKNNNNFKRKNDYKKRNNDTSFRDSSYGNQNGSDEEAESYAVCGRNAVLELLKSGRAVDKLFVRKGDREGSITLIVAEAVARKIPVIEVEKNKIDMLANGTNHQGVAAMAAAKEYVSVDDILKIAEERGEKPFIVIADEIADPHNLGAIIRSAEGAGAHGLIIPKRRSVGLTAAVDKASAGALEHLAIAKVTNLASAIEELKEKGVWIYGAEADGEPYYNTKFDSATAIVVGSEGYGISRLIREKCDFMISIPMYGKVNSLNVSCAAAVVLYEAARRMRGN